MQLHEWAMTTIHKGNLYSHQKAYNALLTGESGILLIRKFYPLPDCQIVADRAHGAMTESFNYNNAIVRTIGTFLMKHVSEPKKYFERANETAADLDNLFHGLVDPRNEIRKAISTLSGKNTELARNEVGEDYCSGVVRLHGKGEGATLHRDNASVDAPAFSVSKYLKQLSCVLMLSDSDAGGELRIYNREWSSDDERYKNVGALGYSTGVISGAKSISLRAQPGDLYIINPNYFHEICPVEGQGYRITLGTFFAHSNNNDHIVFWS